MEAFDMPVLHRPPRLDVNQIDLAFLRPAQHASRGELRSVIGTHVFRLAALFDQLIQFPCHATASQAGIGLQHQEAVKESNKAIEFCDDSGTLFA
jgi:hypothetical protein